MQNLERYSSKTKICSFNENDKDIESDEDDRCNHLQNMMSQTKQALFRANFIKEVKVDSALYYINKKKLKCFDKIIQIINWRIIMF